MLILAGVSLNAIIGDNGIITKAQEATILQSCANIEEFLQEFYVNNMENFSTNNDNKIEAIEQYETSKDYIWNPSAKGYGSYKYIITPDGDKCYFINKAGLPESLRNIIKGGDAGEGTYFDYAQMNDVYGVTSDLKVYYCSKGKSTMLGMAEDKLEKDDPNREVFSNSSTATDSQKAMYGKLKEYDINGDGILASQEIRSVNTLTLTASDNITSLSELSNLTNLNTLILEGMNLDSLDGIDNLPILENLTLTNTVISSYDDLAKCLNLKFLCFLFNDVNFNADLEVKKVCGMNDDGHVGLSKANLKLLNRLAFTGSMANDGNTEQIDNFRSPLKDLSALKNLSSDVKKNVKRLNIQNNHLSNIDFLESFTSLEDINFTFNDVTSAKGVQNCTLLKTLKGEFNSSLGANEGNTVDDENNAFYYIQFCKNLELIRVDGESTKIKYISYIKNLSKLKNFAVSGVDLDVTDLEKCKDFLLKLEWYSLDPKYSLLLIDDNTTKLALAYQKINKKIFKELSSLQNIQELNIEEIVLQNDDGSNVSDAESNTIINDTLKEFGKLKRLDACGTKLSTIDFVYDKNLNKINTPELTILHVRNTAITDLSNLENLNSIRGLSFNNSLIDLSSIQKTISNCSLTSYNHGFRGLYIDNETLLKKLEKCTEITKLCMSCINWSRTYSNLSLDLSNLTKLKTIALEGLNLASITLPSSVNYIEFGNASNFPNLSNLTNLSYLYFYKGGAWDVFADTNVVNSLSSMTFNDDVSIEVHLSGLKDLTNLEFMSSKYNLSKLDLKNCVNLRSLQGIDSLLKIEELNVGGCSLLVDMSGLENLSLLKKLIINGSGIADLSMLKTLTNLNYIDLKNNVSLGNIYGDVDNMKILADLRTANSDLQLYLVGNNNILDWSKLSAFGDWWHDDEKAGY